MEILQITPGAGNMYCGNCLRDNALVAALRKIGHNVLMVPLYLPLTLDETDQTAGTPVFFSGINVYLDQKSPWFRRAPQWLHRLFSRPLFLKLAARQSGNTRADTLGPLTLSMLGGEDGNQARELADLVTWLKSQPTPDFIFLSNALLLGMARQIKAALNRPVVCMLQGEDYFIDSLSEPYQGQCWATLAQKAKDADLFIAPSNYFSKRMQNRMSIAPERLKVVYNGISLEGYSSTNPEAAPKRGSERDSTREAPPVIGYLARMCREKGVDTLVKAFIQLRRRGKVPEAQLRIVGSLGAADQPLIYELQQQLKEAGLLNEASFHPNVDRSTKLELLKSFSVFSVPALYGEAFGLYVIEALAAGVPVIQPRTAAFPELLDLTGGGLLYEPGNVEELAAGLEQLLLDSSRAKMLGDAGRRVVFDRFNSDVMAANLMSALNDPAQARLVQSTL